MVDHSSTYFATNIALGRYHALLRRETLNQESLRWCAVELRRGGGKCTMASDVYVFSMTALEVGSPRPFD
jgi:hypothetical protein